MPDEQFMRLPLRDLRDACSKVGARDLHGAGRSLLDAVRRLRPDYPRSIELPIPSRGFVFHHLEKSIAIGLSLAPEEITRSTALAMHAELALDALRLLIAQEAQAVAA